MNIIDLIVITPGMFQAWHKVCRLAADECRKRGINPAEAFRDCPVEAAREEPDGSVTIYVTLPKGEVAMRIPKGEWTWNN